METWLRASECKLRIEQPSFPVYGDTRLCVAACSGALSGKTTAAGFDGAFDLHQCSCLHTRRNGDAGLSLGWGDGPTRLRLDVGDGARLKSAPGLMCPSLLTRHLAPTRGGRADSRRPVTVERRCDHAKVSPFAPLTTTGRGALRTSTSQQKTVISVCGGRPGPPG